MIFVTVGNAAQAFPRLLYAVDALVQNGFLGRERVFIQTGHNPDITPRSCDYKPFLPLDEFQKAMKEANLILCHAGCGTLLYAVRLGKIPVAMPRRKKYREHVNDHQLQILQALAADGRVVPAYEPEDLPQAITEARKRSVHLCPPSPSHMIVLVAKAIKELTGSKS